MPKAQSPHILPAAGAVYSLLPAPPDPCPHVFSPSRASASDDIWAFRGLPGVPPEDTAPAPVFSFLSAENRSACIPLRRYSSRAPRCTARRSCRAFPAPAGKVRRPQGTADAPRTVWYRTGHCPRYFQTGLSPFPERYFSAFPRLPAFWLPMRHP